MSQFAEWFAPLLLRTSLALVAAALVVAICVKWLRLRSPAGEQWAWLLVLVQGILFISFAIPVPSEWLPVPSAASQPEKSLDLPTASTSQNVPLKLDAMGQPVDRNSKPLESVVEIDAPTVATGVTATVSTQRDTLPSWRIVVCSAWFAGMIAVVVAGLTRYIGFAKRLRAGTAAPAEWVDEWNRACEVAGVGSTISLVLAKNLGPALCRLPAGYQLVVPAQTWQTLSADERRAIYRHELEHYRRGDLWWMLGVRLLASVHWFNPFAWWAARKFEAQSEFACDAAAAGNDPTHFSELLVRLASGRARRIVGVQSVAAGCVYERVQRLLARGSASAPWRAVLPIATAALAICVAGVRLEALADSPAVAGLSGRELDAVEPPAEKAAVLAAADDAAESKTAEPTTPAVTGPTDIAADEIAGVVVDINGKPVAGALVDVWHWAPGNETKTDEQGVFRLAGIEGRERVEVRITKDGYTPAYFPQQPLGAKGWRVELTDKTYIEGVVTGADGKPAAGGEVRAAFGPVQGDGLEIGEVLTVGQIGVDGKYRLYLKPDTYEIQVSAPGQGVKRLSNVIVANDEAKSLSVTLKPGVRFEARVVDSETGKPVEGFILWQWRPPFLFGRSDAEGRIVLTDLVTGTIELSCGGGEGRDLSGMRVYEHGPFGRWWSEQAVSEWERKSITDVATGWQRNFDDLSFDLKRDMSPVEVVVERGVSVSGRVTDPDGNPVAKATVAPAKTGSGNSITGDTRYSVETKEDGTYSVVLPASNAAQYNLIVHDGKYQEWRRWANGVREPMKTTPGQVIENYDLQLTRPAVVRGQVTFAGKPAANREVRTHDFDELENRYYDPTTTTDKDGNFELKFVRPGKHYLQVEPFWLSAEDATGGSKIIKVEAGQTLEGQALVGAASRNESTP